ncbi:MAG: NAD(P)H-dependent oxidoreductase [Verrucomicrobiales bacterium]|nr:NAD(P)H-dependent oxidoreductase [Verrucomicrobiales bacterium]
MKYLIIACSLNPESKSRILAQAALESLKSKNADVELIDLAKLKLPLCDGGAVYGDPAVQELAGKVEAADGILIATPIYNYTINAAVKNMIELTGRAWTEKIAGFLCAAGGQGSYMGIMSIASSLMLDFRTIIIPRFVYATGDQFQGDQISHEDLSERIEQVSDELLRFTSALRSSE